VGVNLAIVVAIFIGGAYFAGTLATYLAAWIAQDNLQKALIWGAALLLALPFLIAAYRKLKALSMLLAELSVRPEKAGRDTARVRKVIAELIPLLSLAGIMLLVMALSASILPTGELLIVIALLAAGVIALLWRWFIRVHSRMQIALFEALDKPEQPH